MQQVKKDCFKVMAALESFLPYFTSSAGKPAEEMKFYYNRLVKKESIWMGFLGGLEAFCQPHIFLGQWVGGLRLANHVDITSKIVADMNELMPKVEKLISALNEECAA